MYLNRDKSNRKGGIIQFLNRSGLSLTEQNELGSIKLALLSQMSENL